MLWNPRHRRFNIRSRWLRRRRPKPPRERSAGRVSPTPRGPGRAWTADEYVGPILETREDMRELSANHFCVWSDWALTLGSIGLIRRRMTSATDVAPWGEGWRGESEGGARGGSRASGEGEGQPRGERPRGRTTWCTRRAIMPGRFCRMELHCGPRRASKNTTTCVARATVT